MFLTDTVKVSFPKVHPEAEVTVLGFLFLFFNNKTLTVPHGTTFLHGKQCEDLNHTWLQICYNMT